MINFSLIESWENNKDICSAKNSKIMKWIFFSTVFFISMVSLSGQATLGVSMTFEQEHIDLGKMKKGETRSFQYVFTNTGKENVEIELVTACECSTVDWPRRPIPPGKKGVIDVVFDSSEKDVSETVEVDITLRNIDPKTGYQIFKILQYSFTLEQ